ncbi:MAG: site-2 protease family protein [Oscillospiraceae bacterium]|nr:site-2 protease family protein [Oscillospiraceae bacterium]
MNADTVISYALTGLAALCAIMFHEVSHGFAAYKLGDMTAKERGRLTLNPLKHIDWFGLLMLIIAGFGWAKPVPVDMRFLRNPRRDMAIIAFAGPAMNFLLALVCMLAYAALVFFEAPPLLARFFIVCTVINIGLGIFNLFPIPPLDGSKMLGIFLPEHVHMKVLRFERYGMLALMALLWTGVLGGPLGFLRGTVLGWYEGAGEWFYRFLHSAVNR